MVKIFYKNKFILLSEKVNEHLFTKINFSDKKELKKQINIFLNDNPSTDINIYNIAEKDYYMFFNEYFVFLKAAGGIVKNEKNEVLFIERLGFADMPKGKLEKDENIKYCAIREVSEECGILQHDLENVKFYQNTYHIYPYKKNFALKQTCWFTMFFSKKYKLKPQIEEEITKVYWVPQNSIVKHYDKMYPSLVELLKNL